jgi:hypothetical protein
MEPDTSPSPVAVSRDVSRYSLSVEEVVLLFDEAGLPRGERSIQKSCKRGDFDAILGDTDRGQRYFVTPESVDRRIKELKQIASQNPKFANVREETRSFANGREQSRTTPNDSTFTSNSEATKEGSKETEKEIKDLELEVLNLKIDNRGKEQFIKQMVEDRKELMNKVREGWEEALKLSATVGELKSQLRLTAPNHPDGISISEETSTVETRNEVMNSGYGQPVDQSHPFEVK